VTQIMGIRQGTIERIGLGRVDTIAGEKKKLRAKIILAVENNWRCK